MPSIIVTNINLRLSHCGYGFHLVRTAPQTPSQQRTHEYLVSGLPSIRVLSLERSNSLWGGETKPDDRGMFWVCSSEASYHILKPLCYTVVSGVDEVDLSSLYSDWTAGCNLSGQLHSSRHHRFLVGKHATAEVR